MFKKNLIHIGTFTKPVGLKGEITIFMLVQNYKMFTKQNSFLFDEKMKNIEVNSHRILKKKLIVKINNISSRNEIIKFSGKKIFLERKNMPKIKDNEFYSLDLVNCKVYIKSNLIGKVISIENFGAGDLINIKPIKGNNFYIPMNEENIVSINVKNKKIFIDPIKGLI